MSADVEGEHRRAEEQGAVQDPGEGAPGDGEERGRRRRLRALPEPPRNHGGHFCLGGNIWDVGVFVVVVVEATDRLSNISTQK